MPILFYLSCPEARNFVTADGQLKVQFVENESYELCNENRSYSFLYSQLRL
jgi:hypothetical protein